VLPELAVVAADEVDEDPPLVPVAQRLAPVLLVDVEPSALTVVVAVAQFLVYRLIPVTPPLALLWRLPAPVLR